MRAYDDRLETIVIIALHFSVPAAAICGGGDQRNPDWLYVARRLNVQVRVSR